MDHYCVECGAEIREDIAFRTPDCPACGTTLRTRTEKPPGS